MTDHLTAAVPAAELPLAGELVVAWPDEGEVPFILEARTDDGGPYPEEARLDAVQAMFPGVGAVRPLSDWGRHTDPDDIDVLRAVVAVDRAVLPPGVEQATGEHTVLTQHRDRGVGVIVAARGSNPGGLLQRTPQPRPQAADGALQPTVFRLSRAGNRTFDTVDEPQRLRAAQLLFDRLYSAEAVGERPQRLAPEVTDAGDLDVEVAVDRRVVAMLRRLESQPVVIPGLGQVTAAVVP